ncbi:polyprenyl synthetase family protein [Pendulispora rubella]|uniref:Polyprenyl synthetase family protein n=1 Tax=Pendulispora rubella TaxID=2741070 RepID=A0ABZ2L4V6_9BACT
MPIAPLRDVAHGADAPALGALFELLEQRLDSLLPNADTAPQELHRAMRHAIFSGGKRLRPRLLLLVASACTPDNWDSDQIEVALLAGCAIELIHCASLVHDDLPSFDDSPLRRGQPTVHMAFGESTAILAGDALLIQAFQILAGAPPSRAPQALELIAWLAKATGSMEGIIGGQSLENAAMTDGESVAELDRYHAMKTAALFRLAAEAGARIAGAADPTSWGEVGLSMGMAFQLADDLSDVHANERGLGKPIGRDEALGRPNAVLRVGSDAVRARLIALLDTARDQISELTNHAKALHALLDKIKAYGASFAHG